MKRVVSVDDFGKNKLLAIRKEHFKKHPTLDPTEVLVSIMGYKRINVSLRVYKELGDFFQQPTAEDFQTYDSDVLKAVRSGDVDGLRKLAQEGKNLRCCNRARESILHVACRRGETEIVRFLIEEAHVPVQVCDDYGRTVMHDACWTSEPNFELMDLVLNQCPDLLFVKDMRGHTPLRYAPRQHWKTLVKYLGRNLSRIVPGKQFQTPV
eukprot:CAMPEP_0172457370 /NCGR_PEP_ID=MMETSP1065-20121228/21804_1 /TAXON_ID=265537 /ORGANISM="Amphiprora paludosa, Strain CCMP125" /LENGTH=208 /DNA_ID=CAMNT_0013211067 /DNA_START=147 /DNA_END=773 /DNA_ORIENTATION=-